MSKRVFIPRLEAFRGVAAMMVAVGHTVGTLTWPANAERARSMIAFLFNGTTAVLVFFVLSGFVLGISLDNSRQTHFWKKYGEFVARRLLRIYPACLISLALALIYIVTLIPKAPFPIVSAWFHQWYGHLPSLGQALGILTFKDIQLNNVSWTLRSEMICSSLLPFMHWASRRSGLALNLLWLGLTIWAGHLLSSQFLNNLYLFYFGLLIPAMVRLPSLTGSVRFWFYPLFVAAGAMALHAGSFGPLHSSWLNLVPGVGAFLLVTAVAMEHRSWVHRFLEISIVRFYGRISYSFYLLHFLTLHVTVTLFVRAAPQGWVGSHVGLATLLFLAISLGIVTPLAWLSWRFVEIPAIRFSKALFSRETESASKPSPAAQPVQATAQ